MSTHRFRDLSFSGIVIDKDGTLLDTEVISFCTYSRLLENYGVRHDPLTHARLMGRPDFDNLRLLRSLHPELPQQDADLYPLRDMQWRIYGELQQKLGIYPMPGAEALLRRCRELEIPVAVATSARRNDTEQQFALLGWTTLFHAVITADDVERTKPAPDVYLEAALALNLQPAQCLAIEDSPHGVASAVTAGMATVFVRDERFNLPVPQTAAYAVGCLNDVMML